MPLIKSKTDFYNRAELGLCGNTPRTWSDAEKFRKESRLKYVGIRKTKTWTPSIYYFLTADDAYNIAKSLKRGSYRITEIPVSTNRAIKHGLQGELTWVNGQWWFYYSHNMGYMREVLKHHGEHLQGWDVVRLLKGHLTRSDFDMLFDLFEHYTEGVDYPTIELANFKCPWGCLDRNLIIWEIRNGY